MISQFVKLLRESIEKEMEVQVRTITKTQYLNAERREAIVSRILTLSWVEEEIGRLYRVDEDDLSGGEPADPPEEKRPTRAIEKVRPRRPRTWE